MRFWPATMKSVGHYCNKIYIRKMAAFMGDAVNVKEGQIMSPKDKDYCADIS